MTCKTSFELHHNFPKLAEESGFTFNTHRPRVHINWNKIKLIDIENLIRDRQFNLIEIHINDILDCMLESEFDVKILDDGVLKMFRLAQLAVEYQQFCRHYLDRSVFILREEVTNLVQDLDTTKKTLREKEEENRKLKRKSRHTIRTPLPYGHENIATMILRTLNQNKGELFAPTSQLETMQYNKCSYCEKVFLNQLYLNSHINRRHANVLEVPQKDLTDGEIANDKNSKLANEVDQLKAKLKQMEDLISNTCNPTNSAAIPVVLKDETLKIEDKACNSNQKKEMKDAEVSTNEEDTILDKIQEWKKEEREKYSEELSSLRKQIIEIINNKEIVENTTAQNELKMMEQLNNTIKEQGNEILALKQELLKGESIEKEKRKKVEDQMAFWIKRAEIQSTEYKSLLQKLNDLAVEAQEFRVQYNTEKERAKQLEELLKQHLNRQSPKVTVNTNKQNITNNAIETKPKENLKITKDVGIKPTADAITLQKLQQKAQELLNFEQTSTSDISSASDDSRKVELAKKEIEYEDNSKKKKNHDDYGQETIKPKPRTILIPDKTELVKNKYRGKKSSTKSNSSALKKGNGYIYIPGSPLKVVRAKITEEVNQRLISLGVDPLNSRLTQNVFQKQRKLLQEQQELKSKNFPSREKVVYSIMCQLNQNTSSANSIQENDYISPSKTRKTFSLSSVLSNVKTKAMSLVKSKETINEYNKTYDDVAKKAMALLKTPPGSAHSSPMLPRRNSAITSPDIKGDGVLKQKNAKYQPKIERIRNKNNASKPYNTRDVSNESCSESDQDNHQGSKKFGTDLVASSMPYVENNNNRNHSHQRREFLRENGSKPEAVNVTTRTFLENKDNSDDVDSLIDISPRKFLSEENISNLKETKGVLKNASSTSSLNKKKVLFDMDAIQMKSVSASPSQSTTEKSEKNENYELGTVNLTTEEWDISSIENEPVKAIDTKIRLSSHTSPKIAELKETIESQLTRRNPTLSTMLVGGVDTLAVPMQKANYGGSNTSLGSSILDDIGSEPELHKAMINPRTAFENEGSEIEISDLIDESIATKKY